MIISTISNRCDLTSNKLITGIDIFKQTRTSLHLYCDNGNEKELFDSLPKFIHDNFAVIMSVDQIFIEL